MNVILAMSSVLIKEVFRKKDFYVALVIALVILIFASRMEFYQVSSAYRYLMELGLALTFFSAALLTVMLAARQFPKELENKTCRVVMARPISRRQFILGKFAGSFISGFATFLLFYAVFLFFAVSKAGALSRVSAFETFYLYTLNLMVLAAMASGLSYFFTYGAAAVLTLAAYFGIAFYGWALKDMGPVAKWVYYAMPHFEFFDMRQRFIHGWPGVSPNLLAALTLYAACYSALFLGLGWLKFRNRDIG